MEKIVIDNFSLSQTLECGQCFHFEKIEEDHYVFVVKDKVYDISQHKNEIILNNITVHDFEKELWDYFDLDTDYKKIQEYLCSKDKKLEQSIKEMSGIKILRQELFETTISFIISSNNQIPRIKKAVKDISEKYGKFLGKYYGMDFYSFPSPERLYGVEAEEYRKLGVGFRDKYIVDAVNKFISGYLDEKEIRNDTEENIYKILMGVKGVGIKVASCITLFSLSKMRSFPIDVWIKRIMQNNYFDGEEVTNNKILEIAKEKFAPYEGYAQQYLFHYGRTNKNV